MSDRMSRSAHQKIPQKRNSLVYLQASVSSSFLFFFLLSLLVFAQYFIRELVHCSTSLYM